MAAIKLQTKTDKQTVMAHLQQALPDLSYKVYPGPVAFSAGTAPLVGCMVAVNKTRINTAPMVHGFGMLFVMILLCLTVIGAIIYGVVFVPKQKIVVQRVDAALRQFAEAHDGGGA